jgi:hypothetical protein
MLWIAALYVGFLAYIGWCSVRSSARDHGAAATALEALTSVGWPVLVAAFFWPGIAAQLGRSVIPIFVVAGTWTTYTLWRDFRPRVIKAKLPEAQRHVGYRVASVLCAAIVVPVVLLGAVVVVRVW